MLRCNGCWALVWARHLIVPGDRAHLNTNRTADPGSMWGRLEYLKKHQKSLGFPQLLFLRVKQFEIRIRSYVLRAGEDLSSLIEENILEKRRWIEFLICVFGGEVRVKETCCSSYEEAS